MEIDFPGFASCILVLDTTARGKRLYPRDRVPYVSNLLTIVLPPAAVNGVNGAEEGFIGQGPGLVYVFLGEPYQRG